MTTPRVVTIGESMILLSSTQHEPLQHSTVMSLGIGGAESNVAIGLQRLGTDATWIGRIGCDSAGDRIERELRAEGVHPLCLRDPDAATSLMIKERRSSIETRVWYYRKHNAGSRLCVDDLDPSVVQTASLLHLTGITPALSPTALQLTLEAVRIARAANVRISFDLNYRRSLWSPAAAAEVYRQIIPFADLVFAGEDEAEIAVGAADSAEDLASRLVALGAGQAVIKLGARGAITFADGQSVAQDAQPVVVRDTVGAGDAFVAGYLSDHLGGEPVETCLATAVKVAAYVCMADGDWEGLPRRHELDALTTTEPVRR